MSHPQSPQIESFVTNSGVRLVCDLYRGGHDSLVVVSHGITANRRLPELIRLAEHLAASHDVLTYDVRGHGESSGRFSFGLHEWRDLAQLVRRYAAGYDRVAGIGFSFGSFHTCVAAAETACFDALVLVSGLARLWMFDHNLFRPGPFIQERRYKRGRRAGGFRPGFELGRRVTPMQCVARVRAPMQIVHGTRDWLIDKKHSEGLAARATAPCDLVIIEGGVHAEFLIDQMPERFLPLVGGWLDEHLGVESVDSVEAAEATDSGASQA